MELKSGVETWKGIRWATIFWNVGKGCMIYVWEFFRRLQLRVLYFYAEDLSWGKTLAKHVEFFQLNSCGGFT